jgi:hypothetical protein
LVPLSSQLPLLSPALLSLALLSLALASPAGRAVVASWSNDQSPADSATASAAVVWPDAGQVGLGGYLVTGRADRARRQHRRREERAWRQGAAHLLKHHLELGEAEPVSAVLLGERQARQAELAGHLPPENLVVTWFCVDRGAHLLLGRLRGEEVADAVAELG